MSENVADQFGANAGIPPPPPDPSMGANVLAMQEALRDVPPVRSAFAPQPSARFASAEEKRAAQVTPSNNPAESLDAARARMIEERGERLSLNAPELSLRVPEIPGYHLHWFLETNIPLALRGWYEFVVPGEVDIPDKNIGGRPNKSATSEDLGGNRITQINKGPGANGLPIQFVLMKIRQEWYFDEQRKIADRNFSIISQIFRLKVPIKEPGERRQDFDMRYTKEALFDMSNGRFRPKEG